MAANPLSVRVTGVEVNLRAMTNQKVNTAIAVNAGLVSAAYVVKGNPETPGTADYYVPKDTEALLKSGHVTGTGKGITFRAALEYGGPSAPYAAFVHEKLEDFHEPPTCAKYLERAVRETRPAQQRAVERTIFDMLRTWEANPLATYRPGERLPTFDTWHRNEG